VDWKNSWKVIFPNTLRFLWKLFTGSKLSLLKIQQMLAISSSVFKKLIQDCFLAHRSGVAATLAKWHTPLRLYFCYIYLIYHRAINIDHFVVRLWNFYIKRFACGAPSAYCNESFKFVCTKQIVILHEHCQQENICKV
jgi:hypothetical protein